MFPQEIPFPSGTKIKFNVFMSLIPSFIKKIKKNTSLSKFPTPVWSGP